MKRIGTTVIVSIIIASACDAEELAVDGEPIESEVTERQLVEYGLDEGEEQSSGSPKMNPDFAVNPVIARVEGENGFVEFIDESLMVPGAGVGVLGVGGFGMGALQWMEKHDASPMEMFAAIGGDVGQTPDRLLMHHESSTGFPWADRTVPRIALNDWTTWSCHYTTACQFIQTYAPSGLWIWLNSGCGATNWQTSAVVSTGVSSSRVLALCQNLRQPHTTVYRVELYFFGQWNLIYGFTDTSYQNGVAYKSDGATLPGYYRITGVSNGSAPWFWAKLWNPY